MTGPWCRSEAVLLQQWSQGASCFSIFSCWLFQQQRQSLEHGHSMRTSLTHSSDKGCTSVWVDLVYEAKLTELGSRRSRRWTWTAGLKIQFKNKEHKWSLTYRWFLRLNICIIFYIKFSSYFQLVLYAVSWTDADFSELNVFPLSESKQS